MINVGYSKKLFAILLDIAKGKRDLKEYAAESGISHVQLKKFSLCKQNGPPTPKLLAKLASVAQNGITYEDFLSICGYREDEVLTSRIDPLCFKAEKLSPAKHKFLEDFADFLAKRG
ncbi:MAG: hypothetical protein E7597_04310 [Ruminococcaceae bacterium]|nr:hypothetical protein [Oscillospiraceae bacterium]